MLHGFTHAHRHELRVLGACIGLLALLAGAVLLIAAVGHLDLSAIRQMREPALAPLAGAVFAVTAIGNTDVIVPLALAGVVLLAVLRHWRGAAALGVSIAVTEGFVALAKHTVERPRPPADDAIAHAAGFSFPSGHAAATAAVFVVLAWLAYRQLRGGWRVGALFTAALIVAAVGLTRIYIGVHYPTDVMAGWLTGGALATASWLGACAVARMLGRVPATRV